MEEGGFEPPKSVTTDLQSAPFGRSGTPPYEIGAGGGSRTPDPLITNQPLWPLSYTSELLSPTAGLMIPKLFVFVNTFFATFLFYFKRRFLCLATTAATAIFLCYAPCAAGKSLRKANTGPVTVTVSAPVAWPTLPGRNWLPATRFTERSFAYDLIGNVFSIYRECAGNS